jgi:DNA-binding transcriptional ArsR family regulator
VEVFGVLADPVRLEIVEMLASGERTAGEIAARFPISGPAVSRHLRVLRDHGFASCRHEAQRRIYSLNPSPLIEVQDWSVALLSAWRNRFEALGRYLDETEQRSNEPE